MKRIICPVKNLSRTLLQPGGSLISILCVVLSLNACTKKKNPVESFQKFKTATDSLTLNHHKIDLNISSVLPDSSTGKSEIAYLSQDTVIVYALSGNQYTEYKKIPLKQYNAIQSFWMPSPDSIYTVNSGNEITLFNGGGNVVKNKFLKQWIRGSIATPLTGDGQNLYVYYYPTNSLNTLKATLAYNKRHIEYVIDKANLGQIKDSIGVCPKRFLKEFYNDNFPWRTEIEGSKMAYSFVVENNLIIYDFQKKTYSNHPMPSNFFHENKEFDWNKIMDYNYIAKYSRENDRYGGIFYDTYRNKIYRVCTHGINFVNKDGTINIYLDKPWSLIISNPDFKIEKEITFPGGIYDFNHIYITSQGVLIKKQNKGYYDKAWVYDVFRF